ncbi:PRC-barrel domain-containing protein [Gramella sp. MAR_2010_147]|uniref:PRC-barrel domain-containing protein n=1 Tax=Gramella sp. MAR_2010_147 TaxID=1250205 RepID=UPI00087CBA7E|nr:PRC-barrel domain-containing protein [Gramella sp. MAR_2010_147]SDR87655.1 PRC-barrel domain-containing protein [Gramella sp. MAR_2010_147]
MSTKEKHLYYLNELKDYKVNSKDPDIRGWEVRDLDNRTIGKVDNFLVNKEAGKVVYVDVEVDQSIIDVNHDPYSSHTHSEIKEFINKEGENHIIIPIGLINLDLKNKYAYSESINYKTFAETKRYRTGTYISRDYEHQVLDSYDRRRDHLNKESELRKTRTAYTDAELEEREIRKNKEVKMHHDRPESETEERIRREKENLRYKSEGHNRPIDDHNRALHHHDPPKDLQPERTIDEDSNWLRDDREIDDEDPYVARRQRNKNNKDFYDREEFDKREY